jgi:hypothetical protein
VALDDLGQALHFVGEVIGGLARKSKGFGRCEAFESLTSTTRGSQATRYGDFSSAPLGGVIVAFRVRSDLAPAALEPLSAPSSTAGNWRCAAVHGSSRVTKAAFHIRQIRPTWGALLICGRKGKWGGARGDRGIVLLRRPFAGDVHGVAWTRSSIRPSSRLRCGRSVGRTPRHPRLILQPCRHGPVLSVRRAREHVR